MTTFIRDNINTDGDYRFNDPNVNLVVDADIIAAGNVKLSAKTIAVLRKIEAMDIQFIATEDFIKAGSIEEKNSCVYEVRGDIIFSLDDKAFEKISALGVKILIDSAGIIRCEAS